MSYFPDRRIFLPSDPRQAGSNANQRHSKNRDRGSAKHSSKTPVLIPLSKKRKRYAIDYREKRIGIIKPGIDQWCAIADLQYGAAQNKLDSPMLAVNWLVDDYKRVSEAGKSFLLATEAGEVGDRRWESFLLALFSRNLELEESVLKLFSGLLRFRSPPLILRSPLSGLRSSFRISCTITSSAKTG